VNAFKHKQFHIQSLVITPQPLICNSLWCRTRQAYPIHDRVFPSFGPKHQAIQLNEAKLISCRVLVITNKLCIENMHTLVCQIIEKFWVRYSIVKVGEINKDNESFKKCNINMGLRQFCIENLYLY
jgi:hypothetical protein